MKPEQIKSAKVDKDAPERLELSIKDFATQEVIFSDSVFPKEFSTGSVGYYLSGKMTNPKSGERYQISCNIILIGSKPGKGE